MGQNVKKIIILGGNAQKYLTATVLPAFPAPPVKILSIVPSVWKNWELFKSYRNRQIGHLEHGVNATGNTKQGHQLVETEEVELGQNS